MTTKQHAPGTPREHAGATYFERNKDSKRLSGFQEQRVLHLLLDGKPRSAADISVALHVSDPRSIIRNLRRKGYDISDCWLQAKHQGRFKRYFIRKEAGNE